MRKLTRNLPDDQLAQYSIEDPESHGNEVGVGVTSVRDVEDLAVGPRETLRLLFGHFGGVGGDGECDDGRRELEVFGSLELGR
jgi:hypothetical protein